MLKLMLITNQPEIATYALKHGVNRIFVDLEILGKQARQGHLDTLISAHSIEDVSRMRSAIGNATLLVRVNPLQENTVAEVDSVIDAGADLIMFPMFHSAETLAEFVDIVADRIPIIPLLETAGATRDIEKIVKMHPFEEIFLGLNDLTLDLGLNFLFEPLSNGLVDQLVRVIKGAGLRFGMGGIARVGEGQLPAEKIIAEHIRLGSSSVILSRSFHRQTQSLAELMACMDFESEIAKIRSVESSLHRSSANELLEMRDDLCLRVQDIVAAKREARLS